MDRLLTAATNNMAIARRDGLTQEAMLKDQKADAVRFIPMIEKCTLVARWDTHTFDLNSGYSEVTCEII